MPVVKFFPHQLAAVYNPYEHFCFWGGVGVGKTLSGAHFAIFHFINKPEHTGLIGANDYHQLSQATLRELFYWLDFYGLEYCIDRIPPADWKIKRGFKSYKNIISVRNPSNGKVAHAFTRAMSDADALRGIEISWYWLDEGRDTPDDTFRVLLGRMREDKNYRKGIITTTTQGEDWVYQTFLKDARRGDRLYGSMHVRTEEMVLNGFHSQGWYDGMRRTFSPLYASQELDAEHVNVRGGRAYYAAGKKNAVPMAPWGDSVPSRERPLIVGCDFNFSPAPCIWMIGQQGPGVFSPKGQLYSQSIHWFNEICETEMSSAGMSRILLQRFPDFYYQIFGDCSGGVGTTSNAGVTDYDQMSMVLSDAFAQFSIDYEQGDEAQNPRVKNRVENMNSLFCNALGEIRQTYNPVSCPHLHDDIKSVGWKPTTSAGRGKLSDGGNNRRTHATDGAGYAVYKVFPPASRFDMVSSISSRVRAENGLLVR